MKGTLLFDIDRTIFDTDKMTQRHLSLVSKILGNVKISDLFREKEKYKNLLENNRQFMPEDFCKIVSEKYNVKKYKKILTVYLGDKYKYIYKESVYPEALKVFEKLKSEYVLGIYSEGTNKYQNFKFNSMGLDKYLNKDFIFIVDAKDNKEILVKLPKNVIIIDDKEMICHFLTNNHFKAIWLNKKDSRNSNKFVTIHSLLDLPNVL